MEIKIDAELQEKMQTIAEAAYPNEACGFFVGTDQGNIRLISDVWEAENVSDENKKRRFTINPKDYLEAEKRAMKEGIVLQGIFHSHPDHPAIPSEHDLKAAVPFFSYIIISVQGGKTDHTRSWILSEEGSFIEEKYKINNK